jgi:hypothetical protein
MTHPDKPLSGFINYPPLTQSQQDILREIGLTLFTVQGIEHILKFLLDFIFPDNPNASLRDLLDGSNEKKKKTLGGFVHELRKRVHVEREFEAMLLKFLTFRNRFIHTLFHEKGFGLGTDEEIQAVNP